MSRILVEARRDPGPGESLDRIAATCRELGHKIFRWRGPLSGRVPYWRMLRACDLAILWNGAHPRYANVLSKLRRQATKFLFVELGWNPQRGTIQIDPQGINAKASWAGAPLDATGRTPLEVREEGDLLLVLQLDEDTQIRQLSPWFPDMRTLTTFVCQNSTLPVRVRPHPRALPDATFRREVEKLGGVWDKSPSLATALAGAKALACANSSCGVEALAAGLPVLCYGQAIYRHAGAVICLADDPQATRDATTALQSGNSGLFREPIQELTGRILARQWPLSTIDERLPAVLQDALAGTIPQPTSPTNWLLSAMCWTRNAPLRLLGGYRASPAGVNHSGERSCLPS